MDIRRVYHKKKPPAWLKCRSERHELEYKILEAAIPNRETAIALEALHSARAIAAEPEIVRAGPWAKPTLEPGWRCEIDAASRIRSLMRLQELGNENKQGPLHRHLADLDFIPASDAPRGAAASRGAVVRRHKTSGTNGNVVRRDQRRRGVKKDYKRSQRGVDYKERRAVEQSRRPSRPHSSRAMKAMKAQ